MRGHAIGIVWVCAIGFLSAAGQMAIIDKSVNRAATKAAVLRSFGSVAVCSTSDRTRQTISEILGPNVQALSVDWYDRARWTDIEVVKDYLNRIVFARPESAPSRLQEWSELVTAEISASVAFQGGQRTRMEFGNGYAHYEDQSGCEWWARYLGSDRSKWIVRR